MLGSYTFVEVSWRWRGSRVARLACGASAEFVLGMVTQGLFGTGTSSPQLLLSFRDSRKVRLIGNREVSSSQTRLRFESHDYLQSAYEKLWFDPNYWYLSAGSVTCYFQIDHRNYNYITLLHNLWTQQNIQDFHQSKRTLHNLELKTSLYTPNLNFLNCHSIRWW